MSAALHTVVLVGYIVCGLFNFDIPGGIVLGCLARGCCVRNKKEWAADCGIGVLQAG